MRTAPRAAVVIDTDLYRQRAMDVPTERPLRMVRVLQEKGTEVHVVEWLRWDDGLGLPAEEARQVPAGVASARGAHPGPASADGSPPREHFHRLTMPVPPGGIATRAAFVRRMTAAVADRIVAAQPEGIASGNEELLLACVRARKRLRRGSGGDVPLFYDSGENWVGMVAEERPLEAKVYALTERVVARHIAHVFAPVRAVKEHWERLGVPASMVYNSRDASALGAHQVPRDEAKRRLGLPEGAFVIGFIGSMHPEQGLAPCVEALAGLPRDVHMVTLGGTAAQRAELTEHAKVQGIADRLTTVAPIPGDEWVQVPSAFDVALLTVNGKGINFEHRLPYKAFDYMALGVPTVVSDYTELREVVVEDAGFGEAVPPGDAAAIREAVLRLHDDEARRRGMAQRALEAFDRTYSGERQKQVLRDTHPFWR